MPAPPLDLVKQWARIDGSEFDSLLPTMIDAATRQAGHETGQGVEYYIAAEVEMPAPVQQWVAATVAYWLANPEAASERVAQPSPFLARLLDPYRIY